MSRYIAVHPADGVYLGHCLGMHFFAGLDPVGQTEAPTFQSVEQMQEYATDENLTLQPKELIHERPFATIAECVAAGATGWNPNSDRS